MWTKLHLRAAPPGCWTPKIPNAPSAPSTRPPSSEHPPSTPPNSLSPPLFP
ncbi:hypothetical protein NFI96_029975 [Prochilodus magdalenae]|nr:hypothetical protein NFI96_029975 [Prochilodus magdalenae]